MADSNNSLAASLPKRPYTELSQLEKLVGKWQVSGDFIKGFAKFEWLEGGFFLVQKVDLHRGDHSIQGMEYIGFDEDTQTLRSHYMDNNGSNFTYTWQIVDRDITIWFGDKDSDNYFSGTFAEDGNSYSGRWQWPGGGYDASMSRL